MSRRKDQVGSELFLCGSMKPDCGLLGAWCVYVGLTHTGNGCEALGGGYGLGETSVSFPEL